jgi:hypothetical protein
MNKINNSLSILFSASKKTPFFSLRSLSKWSFTTVNSHFSSFTSLKNEAFLSATRVFVQGLFILSLLVFATSCSYKKKITATNLSLDPLYGSNMLFMQGDSIIIKGTCSSNGVLAIKLQDGVVMVNADDNGNWKAKFPPIDYKGIFAISVEGKDKVIELDNLISGQLWVVIGDTWLKDSREYIEGKTSIKSRGSNKNVRIYTPPSLFNNSIAKKSGWKELIVSEKTYNEVFAGILGSDLAAFYEQPIGIINLASVGTSMRNFVDDERKLASSRYNQSDIDSLWNEYFTIQDRYNYLADSSFKGIERDVLDRYYDDWDWSDTEFPIITSKRWYLKNTIAWLRKRIFIAEKYITSDFTIEIGMLRGQYDFYFNGTHIERFKGEQNNFKLEIPDSLIKVWSNLLTIRMVAGDSLSGFYSEIPKVYNADSTYRMQIAKDWTIRTYYEPKLPEIKKNSLLWPFVYEKNIVPLKGMNVNAVVLTGSVHQYANVSESLLIESLATLNSCFNSKRNYLYLIPQPNCVDAQENSICYSLIRNTQLVAAAKNNWEIINSIDIAGKSEIEMYQQNMSERLLEKLIE